MTLDDGETELFENLLCVLQLLKLNEREVKVLEERPKVRKDEKAENFHLPFDGNLTRTNARLKEVA